MSSALGKALGMTSTYTWAQVISKIKGVATKTSGRQSVTTSGKWGFDTSYGPWLYIPTNGYYTTSHWLNIPWNTIKSSLGTANTGNVLSGYTFTSQNGIKLSGSIANRSSTIQTATTDASNQSKSCYRINGSNIEIVPAIGYWGNWDWTKSCIRVPVSSALVYTSGTSTAASYDTWTTVTIGWQPRIILGYTNTQGIKAYMYSSVGKSMNYAVDGYNKGSSSTHITVLTNGFKWYATGNSNNGTLNYIAIR